MSNMDTTISEPLRPPFVLQRAFIDYVDTLAKCLHKTG